MGRWGWHNGQIVLEDEERRLELKASDRRLVAAPRPKLVAGCSQFRRQGVAHEHVVQATAVEDGVLDLDLCNCDAVVLTAAVAARLRPRQQEQLQSVADLMHDLAEQGMQLGSFRVSPYVQQVAKDATLAHACRHEMPNDCRKRRRIATCRELPQRLHAHKAVVVDLKLDGLRVAGGRGSLQHHLSAKSKTKGLPLKPELVAARKRSSNHRAGTLKPLKGKSPVSKPCELALPLLFTWVEVWIPPSNCIELKALPPDRDAHTIKLQRQAEKSRGA